jgi:hypothetical protein
MNEHLQRDIGLSDYQEKQVRKPGLNVVFDQKYQQLLGRIERFKASLKMTKVSSPIAVGV